eukprot:7260239-Alexandrium_andersonii.AAC.1
MHEFPKLVPVITGGRPEQAFEARTAVMAHQVLGQQLAGMLDEPGRSRVIHRHPPGPAPEA